MEFPKIRLESSPVLGTLHRPASTIWLLELRNGDDNRLTGEMCQSVILPALDVVEKEWRTQRREAAGNSKGSQAGALIISGRLDQEKFFSNGFDYEEVISTQGLGFVQNNFVPILLRLLTYPVPTIAALNGHTFAAGFMLALACDYRVMTSGKAWACMNEVHFGAPFPHGFAALLQEKAKNPVIIRSIALEGHKFTPRELYDAGLVDYVAEGGTHGVLEKATDIARRVGQNASTGVWGLIKREIYTEAIAKITQDMRQVMPFEDDALSKARL